METGALRGVCRRTFRRGHRPCCHVGVFVGHGRRSRRNNAGLPVVLVSVPWGFYWYPVGTGSRGDSPASIEARPPDDRSADADCRDSSGRPCSDGCSWGARIAKRGACFARVVRGLYWCGQTSRTRQPLCLYGGQGQPLMLGRGQNGARKKRGRGRHWQYT
jgi:hypothetical protein